MFAMIGLQMFQQALGELLLRGERLWQLAVNSLRILLKERNFVVIVLKKFVVWFDPITSGQSSHAHVHPIRLTHKGQVAQRLTVLQHLEHSSLMPTMNTNRFVNTEPFFSQQAK